MFCHYRRSAPATKQRDKMCLWSTAGTPNPPGQAPPDTRQVLRFLFVKSDPFGDIPAAPGGLANASRPHSKLCTRSPLSGELITGNPPLVTASARNPRPFTFVHSHAAAQKSSGAFFRVMARERCRKRPARVRNALRGSQGVRPRDVMVNSSGYKLTLIVKQ
ncbi:hypothetical protein AI2614V1_5979 (plasmid) [Klebsiella oxytoca]|nr:hypothetical protein AI2614V1_5979 [Klebsiella oxytoca]CAH3953847.1 hypothetical protein AI2614V1_5979 [Klebsiella oxytoca]